MKIVLANWGRRGDLEPCIAVGCELRRRGHDVLMALPPDLLDFAESVGLAGVACGPDTHDIMVATRAYWSSLFGSPWKFREVGRLQRAVEEGIDTCWREIGSTLTSVADGADLLFTGVNFEFAAANVAEHLGIPLATLHWFPVRANSRVTPFLPRALGRAFTSAFWWLSWRGSSKIEEAQRLELGLPSTRVSAPRRITERGSLEIQAYEPECFPGLAAEWARRKDQRPFVGALTMGLATENDEEVASWIAAGTPPICFGFGSSALESAADTLAVISGACAQLGERALLCAASTDFSSIPTPDHVKVVPTMNYQAAFPRCRAVVHHGGSGTTAACLRAGVPMLILWSMPDQPIWGAVVKRLKVGAARRFSATTEKSLISDLRTILDPKYNARAREVATRMTNPADGIVVTADLVEKFATTRRSR